MWELYDRLIDEIPADIKFKSVTVGPYMDCGGIFRKCLRTCHDNGCANLASKYKNC